MHCILDSGHSLLDLSACLAMVRTASSVASPIAEGSVPRIVSDELPDFSVQPSQHGQSLLVGPVEALHDPPDLAWGQEFGSLLDQLSQLAPVGIYLLLLGYPPLADHLLARSCIPGVPGEPCCFHVSSCSRFFLTQRGCSRVMRAFRPAAPLVPAVAPMSCPSAGRLPPAVTSTPAWSSLGSLVDGVPVLARSFFSRAGLSRRSLFGPGDQSGPSG
jgi:hypothetical protein